MDNISGINKLNKPVRNRFIKLIVLLAGLYPPGAYPVTYTAGDVAPYGNPDGIINVADTVILQHFIFGDLVPTPTEQLICDVAPLGSPDGELNVADLVVLQRAIFGEITLPPVVIGPDAPFLYAGQSPTNDNPYLLTGTADADAEVRVYVNGTQQQTMMADASGNFRFYVSLQEGGNSIYATIWDGASESDPSNTLSVDFVSLPPTAVIGGHSQGPVNNKTFFDGSGSFDRYYRILTYNWDFGDGSTGTGDTPFHVYSSTGTYTVTLTVTAGGQTSEPVISAVTIKNTQTLYPILSDGTTLTADKIYILDGSGFGSGEVTLPQGASMTIEAGADLRFTYPTKFVVHGTLDVRGTASNPVRFTRLNSPAEHNTTDAWDGIWLTEYCNASIDHAIVEGGRYGIIAFYTGNNVEIKNSTIQNNNISGIDINSSSYFGYTDESLIKGNRIEYNDAGIALTGNANPLIIDGNIIRYNDEGIHTYATIYDGNPRPVITGNAIYHNYRNYHAYVTRPQQEIVLNTQDNWWGTTDTALINRDIYDSRDEPERATVDYSKFRTQPLDYKLALDPVHYETADYPYVVSGTAPPGAEINLYAFGSELLPAGNAIADAEGRFSVDVFFPAEDDYSLFARRVVGGEEVEESEWTINSIYYTPEPWWPDVPVLDPITSPTATNPVWVVVSNPGLYFREANFYVNGKLQGMASEISYRDIWFEAVLSVGTNTIYATFLDSDGESAPSQTITVEYQPDGGVPLFSGGTVNGHTVLPPTVSPYQITSDIIIDPGGKLTILAGSVLEFGSDTYLVAAGELDILGTPGNPVHLKSASLTPAPDDWLGVIITDLSQQRRIENVVIEHALAGIWFDGGSALVDNALLQNNYYGLLATSGASPVIAHTTIQNNTIGIWADTAASPEIYPHNTITGNDQGVVFQGTGLPGGSPAPVIHENNLFGNTDFDLGLSDFYDPQNVYFDARGNWWGTAVPTSIDNQIYDGKYPAANAPLVTYLPVQPAVLTADSPLSPTLEITAPSTSTPAYTVNGTAGLNREIRLYLNGQLEATLSSDATGYFSQTVTLTPGSNTLYANAVNGTEESLPYNTYSVVLDQVAPNITLTNPLEGGLVNYATFIGQMDEAATVTVNGEPATVNADNSFNHVLGGLPQGANTVTVVATDPAGNSGSLDVSFTLDSQPPAAPDTSLITVGPVSGGQVTVAGPAGGATAGDTVTLTNIRTGQAVQTTVNGNGSYTAQLGAQDGDEIVILLSDSAGNAASSRMLQVAGTPPALGLVVTSPLDGSSIAGDRVGVSGTYQGPANVGITVNGAAAQTFGNTFCVGGVLLDTGANQLDVTATTADGTTTTQSLTVTRTGGSLVELEADANIGFAPHLATFSLMDSTGATLTTIEYDIDSDGTPDYTTNDPAASIQHTYTTPGCYTATVTATDDAAGTYTGSQTIAVREISGLDGHLRGIFHRMLGNLRNGNIGSAMEALTDTMRTKYESQFNALNTADLVTLVNSLGTIEGGGTTGDVAEYVIVREEGGILRAFTLYFIQGSDGLWRIAEM